MQLKYDILQAALKVFNAKGLKFTMDDIAKALGISKKTIYTVFPDKETLFFTMVDYLFDNIKESEEAIVNDTGLSTAEKIKRILGVMPEGYRDIDFGQLYGLRDKYPKIYKKVEERLETGWESTIELLEQGIKEGCVKPVNIPILKMMFEASLEQFFKRDILKRNQLTYGEALDEVVAILLEGIMN